MITRNKYTESKFVIFLLISYLYQIENEKYLQTFKNNKNNNMNMDIFNHHCHQTYLKNLLHLLRCSFYFHFVQLSNYSI